MRGNENKNSELMVGQLRIYYLRPPSIMQYISLINKDRILRNPIPKPRFRSKSPATSLNRDWLHKLTISLQSFFFLHIVEYWVSKRKKCFNKSNKAKQNIIKLIWQTIQRLKFIQSLRITLSNHSRFKDCLTKKKHATGMYAILFPFNLKHSIF